jgi:hypothetical protein
MSPAVGQMVRERAGFRCEYCHLPQIFSALLFHVEHIIARQHGGSDDLDNLALACPECNLRKGTNLTGIDPDTGEVVRLFNPRKDMWDEHFSLQQYLIAGRTPLGRTTAWLLAMNTGDRMRWRRLLVGLGKQS